MSVITLGLASPVTTVAGTPGQILVNGQYLPLNGAVTIALDGALSGATGFYSVLTGMSGALVLQIQSAAGVLSLNNVTGLLTLTSAPANANYVKVTTSGTTIYVSGDSVPLLSGVSLAGGAQMSGNGGSLFLSTAAATNGDINLATSSAGKTIVSLAGLANGYFLIKPTAITTLNWYSQTQDNNGNFIEGTNSNGTHFFGTNTDSANGRLQLVTHTTSGGGLGLGPDISLYRSTLYGASAPTFGRGTGSWLVFASSNYAPRIGQLDGDAPHFAIQADAGGSVKLRVNGSSSNALSLDSAAVASFASKVLVSGASDQGNGAVQLVTHTTSGGGLGLGPDNSIWRTAANAIQSNSALTLSSVAAGAAFAGLRVQNSSTVANSDTTIQLVSDDLAATQGAKLIARRLGAGNGLTNLILGGANTAGTFVPALTLDGGGAATLSGASTQSTIAQLLDVRFSGASNGSSGLFRIVVNQGQEANISLSQSNRGTLFIQNLASAANPSTMQFSADVAAPFQFANSNGRLLTIGAGGDTTTSGRLILGTTGDYTAANAASVAQLLAASGWLTNAATSNVVYTTGNQSIGGTKTFSNSVIGNGVFSAAGGFVTSTNGAANDVRFGATAAGTGMGLFFPTIYSMAWANSGVERMRLTDVGGLGIGTTTPTGLLHLYGTTQQVRLLIAAEGADNDPVIQLQTVGENNWTVGVDDSQSDTFKIALATGFGSVGDFFSITSGGNVGIGITNPTTILHVSGAGGLRVAATNAYGLITLDNAGATASTIGTNFSFNNGEIEMKPGGLFALVASPNQGVKIGGALGAATPANGLFVVGNVGVGVSNPTSKLVVSGTALFTDVVTCGSGIVMPSGATTTGAGIAWNDLVIYREAPGRAALDAYAGNSRLVFRDVGALKLDINSAGGAATIAGGTNVALQVNASSSAKTALMANQDTTVTFSSGIILGTSNVTGGGIAFGPNGNIFTSAANALTFQTQGNNLTWNGSTLTPGDDAIRELGTSALTWNKGYINTISSKSAVPLVLQTNGSATALVLGIDQGVTGARWVSAQSYRVAVSGAAIPVAAGATGTYNIDFANSPALQTLTITGATLFSGVNYVAGGAVTIRVNVSGSNSVPIRFPASWNNGWVMAVPTGLATGRFAVMTLNTFAANDTGVAIAFAVAP